MKQHSAVAQLLALPLCWTLLVADESQPALLGVGAMGVYRVAGTKPPAYGSFLLGQIWWLSLN